MYIGRLFRSLSLPHLSYVMLLCMQQLKLVLFIHPIHYRNPYQSGSTSSAASTPYLSVSPYLSFSLQRHFLWLPMSAHHHPLHRCLHLLFSFCTYRVYLYWAVVTRKDKVATLLRHCTTLYRHFFPLPQTKKEDFPEQVSLKEQFFHERREEHARTRTHPNEEDKLLLRST